MKGSYPDKMSLEIFSCRENIVAVDPFVDQLVKEYSIKEEDVFRIRLCLTEAVNNAIFHGNGECDDKKVFLSAEQSDSKKITFTIKDEGNGFDLSKVNNPTHDEFVNEPNGRGVYLIKELCDGTRFINNGSTLIIEFNIL